MRVLYIIVFGLCGVLSRYGISTFVIGHWPTRYPWATFFINLGGSFLIGVIYVLGAERSVLSPDVRVGLMTGLLGGYTTFSAFSLETTRLFESGEWKRAVFYATLSPVLGIFCAWAGLQVTRLAIH